MVGWKRQYFRGAAMEIYPESLSEFFVGLTFTQAALYDIDKLLCFAVLNAKSYKIYHISICKIIFRICYKKLKLLLIAIEEEPSRCRRGQVFVNPGNSATIKSRTIGIFIGDSAEEVIRYIFIFSFFLYNDS